MFYKVSNMLCSIYNSTSNLLTNTTNYIYNKFEGHFIGINSLYIFIQILYNVNNIIKKQLYDDDIELEKIKTKIFKCGCIGIKFTQWIISKLKGTEHNQKYSKIISYFEDIFDNCGNHNIKYTENIFKKDFGKELGDIFDMNNFEIIASGSIGQVYKTRFKKKKTHDVNIIQSEKFNKDDICIKVRHPFIDYIKSYQMLFIYFIIMLQKINYFKKKYNLHFNLFDFIDNINKQIDFNIEAYNNIKIYNSYKDNEYIIIPKVHNFSKNIIISSFEHGQSVDDISEYQQCKVALNMLCLVYNMAIVDNFMHGDLHIKNWAVRPYKKMYQIIVYDFGICFYGPTSEYAEKLLYYAEIQDIKNLIRVFLDDSNYENKNKEELLNELYNIFKDICNEPFNMNIVYNKLIYLFSSYNLIINNLFLNILVFFCLVEDLWKRTNIICQDASILDLKSILKNQKLDVISFCKTYNIYPKLQKIFEKQLKIYFNKNIIKNNELLNSYKLANIDFLNPDDI
jgi:predicted unusual protein kinase regulating ubiquinone biosynthesis (AarF/ABC1/UbiB family)